MLPLIVSMSVPFLCTLIGLVSLKLYTKLSAGQCDCSTNLQGKTVVITGGGGGIGRQTAVRLAAAGARLILPVRSVERGREIALQITQATGNTQVHVVQCDLSSLKSVRDCCNRILSHESRLDLLVLNAAMVPPPGRFLTEDFLELQMASNHIGHFLMVNLLLPLMHQTVERSKITNVDFIPVSDTKMPTDQQLWPRDLSQCCLHPQPLPNPRIVVVSSLLHQLGQIQFDNLNCERQVRDPFWIYCNSKLANLLLVKRLSEQLKQQNSPITINGLHPGMVRTDINRRTPFYVKHLIQPIAGMWAKSARSGAQTSLHVCLAPHLKGVSGRYFVDCAPTPWSKKCDDLVLADRLWSACEQMTGLKKSSENEAEIYKYEIQGRTALI